MTNIEKEVLRLYQAGMLGNKLDFPTFETKEEVNHFLRVVGDQAFLPYLYKVYKIPQFKKYYLSNFMFIENMKNCKKEIIEVMDSINASYFFMKGSVLYELYKDPSLRTMGDIDMVVKKDEFEKAKEALIAKGWHPEEHISTNHIGLQKGNVLLELHFALCAVDTYKKEFFDDDFDHLDKVNHKLEDTYHLFFVLVHYVKHLRQGAGIRELGDVYLMMKKMDINKEYLEAGLKELELEGFFKILMDISSVLFEGKDINEFEESYKRDLVDIMHYLLTSGIHGFGENNERDKNALNNSKQNKFKYLLSKVFLKKEMLFNMYPYSKHILLRPFAYIQRFFSLLFRKDTRKRFKETVEAKVDEKEVTIFDKMKIKD